MKYFFSAWSNAFAKKIINTIFRWETCWENLTKFNQMVLILFCHHFLCCTHSLLRHKLRVFCATAWMSPYWDCKPDLPLWWTDRGYKKRWLLDKSAGIPWLVSTIKGPTAHCMSHICIDPGTVHPTSQHSFKYDGQGKNMTTLWIFSD